MSFLNSVLSSIGGTGPQPRQPTTPPIQPSRPPNTATTPALNQPQPGSLPIRNDDIQRRKRKAEDGLGGPNSKSMKNEDGDSRNSSALPLIDPRAAKLSQPIKPASASSPNLAMPYRGTSKLNPASASRVVPSPTPVAQSAEATKTPKKGSYAEIMARAKVTQLKPPAVGVISHKPKDKIAVSHKKELKMKKKAIKDKKLGIKHEGRPGSSGSLSTSPAPALSNTKKVPQPPYKGTAKPKPQPTYKGTMKSGSSVPQKSTSKDRDGYASRNRYNEYAATDEDDLDDVEDDISGAEGSDDMEAGFSDVEQEESAAAKAARKEDEEEARLEARLKNEKEERKKRLEAMAKKAKPQRY